MDAGSRVAPHRMETEHNKKASTISTSTMSVT